MGQFFIADLNILKRSLLWLDNLYAAAYFAYRRMVSDTSATNRTTSAG